MHSVLLEFFLTIWGDIEMAGYEGDCIFEWTLPLLPLLLDVLYCVMNLLMY